MRPVLSATGFPVTEEIFTTTKSQVDVFERQLIRRVLAGDHEALRELVRPCEHAVFMTTKLATLLHQVWMELELRPEKYKQVRPC